MRLNLNKWHQNLTRSDLFCCVCVNKMVEKVATKFEIPEFNGRNSTMQKVNMHTILVKDGCAIGLKGKTLKPQGMPCAKFDEKDEITKAWPWMRMCCLICKSLIQ